MAGVCRETETELVINHSFRFTAKLQALRELILEDGLIGDVRSVDARFRMELIGNSTHLLDTIAYLLLTTADTVMGYVTGENEVVEGLGAGIDVDDAGGGGVVAMQDDTFVTVDCTLPRDISSIAAQMFGTEGKLYLNNDDGECATGTLRATSTWNDPSPIARGPGPGRRTTAPRSNGRSST